MSHNQNTIKGGCPFNIFTNISTSNSVPLDEISEHKRNMFKPIATAMETALTAMGKTWMKVSIEAVTKLSSQNASKFSRENKNYKAGKPDYSDSSNFGCGSDEGETDNISMPESDRTFYTEDVTATTFLKDTPSSSSSATGSRTEGNIEQFSEKYTGNSEKWGEGVSEEIIKVFP